MLGLARLGSVALSVCDVHRSSPLGMVTLSDLQRTNEGFGTAIAEAPVAPAQGGETLLLPFTKRVAPRIDFDAGRIVIEPPREVEDED